ncbi:MAG: hypothetical protein AAFP89_12705 [Bacteroidota bacterium]
MTFESYTQYLETESSPINELAMTLISLGDQFENGADNVDQVESQGHELDEALVSAEIDPQQKEGLKKLAKKAKQIRKATSTTGPRPAKELADFLGILPTDHTGIDQLVETIIQTRTADPAAVIETEMNQLISSLKTDTLTDAKRAEVIEFIEFLQG